MYGDPTGEVPLLAAAPFVAGAVAVGKFLLDMRVAFLVMEAFSGFPLVDCLENLYKKCFNISIEDCWQTGINAGSAFGFGAVTGIIGKGLKWVAGFLFRDRVVIGKLSDIGAAKLRHGERNLLSQLPNRGTPKANYQQNSSVLRREMRANRPIRDATVGKRGDLRDNTGFLRAERDILQNRGWRYDQTSHLWNPPL